MQRWIDRDLFIADMQGGDLNSRFCSPFLVNALLAVACVRFVLVIILNVANLSPSVLPRPDALIKLGNRCCPPWRPRILQRGKAIVGPGGRQTVLNEFSGSLRIIPWVRIAAVFRRLFCSLTRTASAWAMGTHMLAWQYLVDIADCVRKLMAQRNTIIARAKPDCQTLVRAFETAITGSFSVPS